MTTTTVHDLHREPTPAPGRVDRAAVKGGAIGFVAFALVITVGCAIGGIELTSALALGVYVGLFGGVGFGAMLASVLFLSRREAQEDGDS